MPRKQYTAVSLPINLIKEIDAYILKYHYPSRAALVITAIREKLEKKK